MFVEKDCGRNVCLFLLFLSHSYGCLVIFCIVLRSSILNISASAAVKVRFLHRDRVFTCFSWPYHPTASKFNRRDHITHRLVNDNMELASYVQWANCHAVRGHYPSRLPLLLGQQNIVFILSSVFASFCVFFLVSNFRSSCAKLM